MSVSEILAELPRLDAADRQVILERIVALDSNSEAEVSPEVLAGIDEGIASANAGPLISLEELKEKVRQWTSR